MTTLGASTARSADAEGLGTFLCARARLFGIAYRVLGSAVDAEDVVQDVWIRWQKTDRSVVRDAAAFLATMTLRVALNVIQSARARREILVGSCSAESIDNCDPGSLAERNEALRGAVRALLERLSPAERAAYVLREGFDYRYGEIARILHLQEAHARQLVTRARRHVVGERRAASCPDQQRHVLAAITVASQTGALNALEAVLAAGMALTAAG